MPRQQGPRTSQLWPVRAGLGDVQRPVEVMGAALRLAWRCHRGGLADPSDRSPPRGAQGLMLIILSKGWIKINYKTEIKRWLL